MKEAQRCERYAVSEENTTKLLILVPHTDILYAYPSQILRNPITSQLHFATGLCLDDGFT